MEEILERIEVELLQHFL